MKFHTDVSGFVTGIRFYKGAGNTGSHVANLWSSSGTLLASATFTSETATGWQQVNFASRVAVTAGATYVVSYHTDTGNYAQDVNYFTNGADRGPLHAPSTASSGGNGLYAYGGSAFPTNSWNASNYWVDVVFQP